MTSNTKKNTRLCLMTLGAFLLLYAVLGNYIALPGYIRFLERGGRSATGHTFDLSVLIGAVKTIIWMYSFQLGVLLLSIAYSIRERLHTKSLLLFGIVWLALWSWPKLSAPGPWFYILFGSIIMVFIVLVFTNPKQGSDRPLNKSLFLGSIIFFSFATWEVCGLGSTGRMLHPDQSSTPLALNLLITQSTKLMIEFVLAWGLLLSSRVISKKTHEE